MAVEPRHLQGHRTLAWEALRLTCVSEAAWLPQSIPPLGWVKKVVALEGLEPASELA